MKQFSKIIVTLMFIITVMTIAFVPASAATVPAKVTGLKASSITYNSAKLSWSKAKNTNKYYVEVYNASTKKWKVLTNLKGTSYNVTKLTTGTTYKYRVRGYRTVNRKYGKYSVVLSVKPMPVKVTGFKASSVTPVSATLGWTKVAGATGYTVQQYKSSKWVNVKSVKTNSLAVKGLTPNSTTKYRVAAYTTVAKKNYYGAYTSALSVKTTVGQVKGLKAAQVNPASAKLTWTAVTGATGYEVYNGKTKVATVTKNTATVKSLVPGTKYSFTVKAYVTASKKNYYGAASAAVSFKPVLAAASGLKVDSATNDTIKFSWKDSTSTGVTGYQLYNGTTKVATVKYGTTTYTLTGLSPMTVVTFKVVAYYSSLTSKELKITAATVPGVVTGLKLDGGTNSKAAISWDAMSGADGYYIYSDGAQIASSKAATAEISGIAAKKLHKITVAAYHTKNGAALTGPQSDAIPVALVGSLSVTESSITNIPSQYQNYYVWNSIDKSAYPDLSIRYFINDSDSEDEKSSESLFYSFNSKKNDALNVSVSENSDGTATISWNAVDNADGYIVQTVADDQKGYSQSWETVFDSATGNGSKTATSFKTIFPNEMKFAVRVIAYDRQISVTGYAVDEEFDKLYPVTDTFTRSLPLSVGVVENYVQTGTPSASTNIGKTKIVLAAVQAINNTKAETGRVTATSSTQIDGSMDKTTVSYTNLIGKKKEGDLSFLMNIISSVAGGEDLDDISESVGESSSASGTFLNGSGSVTVTSSDGSTKTGTSTLEKFITPQGRKAYLYNALDYANINSKIPTASISKSDGKTTINFTIAQETATASNPSTPVHDGIVEGFSEVVESMASMSDSAYVRTGATTVSVVINENGTLDSLNTNSPYEFKMSMDAGDVSIPLYGTIHTINMVLSGNANYGYTFTR